ncbi:MAG: hypothetical protein M3Y54_09405 [Bacteroidota bacterium]|nr:hypothetical protein [Bacteroidota bacterium]
MQTLTEQLETAIAPHLSPDAAAPTRTLKSVAKTLKQLARQLTKQRVEQEKAAAPTAQKQRKVLAGELIASLKPHLGNEQNSKDAVPKAVTKLVKHLAAQLVKQRRQQDKQIARMARKAAKQKNVKQVLAPVLKVVRLAPAANGQPAARSVRAKRATSNGSLNAGSAPKKLAATTSAA